MSQPTQPVPDAALTAALGGYYGHPTAITAADPDVIDGLTAGLAAGMAERRRLRSATAFLVATLNPRDIGRARRGMHRRMYVHVGPLLDLIDEIERQCPGAIEQQRAAIIRVTS